MKHWIYWMIALGAAMNIMETSPVTAENDKIELGTVVVSGLFGATWPIWVGVYFTDEFNDKFGTADK